MDLYEWISKLVMFGSIAFHFSLIYWFGIRGWNKE